MNLFRFIYLRLITGRGLYLRLNSERGQTMAEYAILIAVVAVVVVAAAVVFGSSITGIFRDSSTHL